LLRHSEASHRFPFIEVATQAETLQLAAAIGGTSFGSTTVELADER
jgi:hypothetical protein